MSKEINTNQVLALKEIPYEEWEIGAQYLAATIDYDGQPAGTVIKGVLLGDYDGTALIRVSGVIKGVLLGYDEDSDSEEESGVFHHLEGGIFCEIKEKLPTLHS